MLPAKLDVLANNVSEEMPSGYYAPLRSELISYQGSSNLPYSSLALSITRSSGISSVYHSQIRTCLLCLKSGHFNFESVTLNSFYLNI